MSKQFIRTAKRKIRKDISRSASVSIGNAMADATLVAAEGDETLIRIVGNVCIYRTGATGNTDAAVEIAFCRNGTSLYTMSMTQDVDGRDAEPVLWHGVLGRAGS